MADDIKALSDAELAAELTQNGVEPAATREQQEQQLVDMYAQTVTETEAAPAADAHEATPAATSAEERRKLRKERFGLSDSPDERKLKRVERFGGKIEKSSGPLSDSATIKKRQERFGVVNAAKDAAPVAVDPAVVAQRSARAARFGTATNGAAPAAVETDPKKLARAERFKTTPSTAPSS